MRQEAQLYHSRYWNAEGDREIIVSCVSELTVRHRTLFERSLTYSCCKLFLCRTSLDFRGENRTSDCMRENKIHLSILLSAHNYSIQRTTRLNLTSVAVSTDEFILLHHSSDHSSTPLSLIQNDVTITENCQLLVVLHRDRASLVVSMPLRNARNPMDEKVTTGHLGTPPGQTQSRPSKVWMVL